MITVYYLIFYVLVMTIGVLVVEDGYNIAKENIKDAYDEEPLYLFVIWVVLLPLGVLFGWLLD